MSAEAANRDLEARLSRANEDRRAAEPRLTDLTRERDRLITRVKTLERDLGTARKAAGAPAKPPAQTGEGPEGTEGPPVERAGGGGGGNAVVARNLLAGAQAWHAQAEACAGRMSAVWTGLRMAMLAAGRGGQRGAGHGQGQCRPRGRAPAVPPPPPTASRQRRWTPFSLRRWWSRLPREPLAGALLQEGGGGGRSSPFYFGTTCHF